jgi:hypothetical protein
MSYYRGDYYRGDYYRGDPGLFSFLGKALGGVVKLAGGAVKSALGLAPPTTVTSIIPTYQQPGFAGPGPMIGATPPPGVLQTGLININRPLPPTYDGQSMVGLAPMMMAGQACGKGFHLNKSRYVTRGGGTSHYPMGLQLHERGTVCVKTRRMNVGNARALRRALRRVSGFAKLVKRSRRAVARAASAVGVHHRGGKGRSRAPSVRIVKAA